MTPQEQSGIGTPKIEAFNMDRIPGFPIFLATISFDVIRNSIPDIKKPSIKNGAIITNKWNISFKYSMNKGTILFINVSFNYNFLFNYFPKKQSPQD